MLLFTVAMLAQAAATPTQATTPPKDEIVCRMIQEPHSRIPKRVCRTETEWAQIAKDAQESMRASWNDRTTGGPSN